MKKFRIALMSIFTLLLGSVLVGCNFKKPEIDFSEDQVYVSAGQSIDLKKYLNVKEADISEIKFKFEDSSLFQIDGDQIKTKNKSGESYVYATYNDNIFASIKVYIKQKFSTPKNFSISDTGLISWDKSFAIYSSASEPTFASSYKIYGTFTAYEDGQATEAAAFDETTTSNSFQLQNEGIYNIKISAQETNRFDASLEYDVPSFGFGYMPQIARENMTWSEGVLSWEDAQIEDAQFEVYVDGNKVVEKQTESSADLSEIFDDLSASVHTIKIVVYDAVGDKMPTDSETISVFKLASPVATYAFSAENGGTISLAANNLVDHYEFTVSDGETEEMILVENENGVSTALDEIDAGIYTLSIQAIAIEGNYYQSDKVSFGKIYKLETPTISGKTGNAENSNIFKLLAQANTDVDTKISVLTNQTKAVFDGIVAGEESADFEVEVSGEGVYSIVAKQIAKTQQNTIAGSNVYVLNSNKSEELIVEKLETIGNVSHAIENEKSVLTFGEVENAEQYKLFALSGQEFVEIDESLYECQIDESSVKVVFVDTIENLGLAQNSGVYTLKVVAKKNDETLSISSSKQKVLTELAIATNVEKENLNKTYSWTSVENADSYKILIYVIDKETFTAGQTDIDTTSLDLTEVVVEENSYTFTGEGYYLVKVFSLTDNKNEYINSTASFDNFVCVSEKLVVEDFDISFASGVYNVEIENAAHFDKYEIYLDNEKIIDTTAQVGVKSTYILETNFSDTTKTYKIEVVAKSNDSTLYENSEKNAVMVKKLPQIVGEDVEVGVQSITVGSNMKSSTQAQEISVSTIAGARGVLLYQQTNPSERAGGEEAATATYNFDLSTNIDFVFKYFGSTKNGNVFVKSNGYIYLDSEESVINISRLETPTNFEYVDGALRFVNTNTALTDYYVLTIVCKDQTGERKNIVVSLADTATASFGENAETIGQGSDFVSNDVNLVSIELVDILDAVSQISDVEIRQVYSQAVSYGFAVYCYANIVEDDSVVLSSNYAGIATDASTKVVIVEKMAAPEITYQIVGENIVFNWDAVSTDAAVAAQTTYQMHVNGNNYGQVISGTVTASYSLSEFEKGTYYTFALSAQNPNYIESNQSNAVRIFRLNKITSLRLLTGGDYDGQLQYELPALEQEYVDYVLVGENHNQTGKIEISAPGTLSLKVVGKKNVESSNMTTEYIDSDVTTWTISQMQNLKSAEENFVYENGVLSWDKFAEGYNFENLRYVLIFEDSENNIVSYVTNTNSVSISETTLEETLQRLAEGSINIYLYAKFESYDVVAGGTIYYAGQITLENNSDVSNYHKYANSLSINKLPTPIVSNVRFVEDSANGVYNTPDIEITFTGDYGNEADFVIAAVVDGQEIVSETVTLTKQSDAYKYVLQAEKYRSKFVAGKTIVFQILALSQVNIPSSMGSVSVLCANTISNIALRTNESDVGISHVLKIDVAQTDVQSTVGGFVLRYVFTENGGTEQTKYVTKTVSTVASSQTFDITDFLEANLANGGEVVISAVIRAYSNTDNKVYILACPTYVSSEKYNVLAEVTLEDITKSSGGFEIDKTINNQTTKYKVVYGANSFDVLYQDDKFYFEVPTIWVNGSYNLRIYAVEADYVYSKQLYYTFVLNRIDDVTSVEIERDNNDLSDGTISWTNVSGAAGYMLKIYTDNTRSTEIVRVTTLTNSLKFSEVFTEEVYDDLRIGETDVNIYMGITALGQNASANDSQEYSFNAKVCANYFDVENEIGLNEYGLVTFAAVAGKTYIYRFVDTTGVVLSDWVEVTAESDVVTIDASVLNRDSSNNVRPAGTVFDIEIIVIGNYDSDIVSFNSKPISTDESSVKFLINSEINKIEYKALYADYICFDMQTFEAVAAVDDEEDETPESNAVDILYYGVEEDAIKTGKVSVLNTRVLADNGDGTSVYGCKLIDLIMDFSGNEVFGEIPSGDVTLYFWSYRKGDGNVLTDYINSPSKTYAFNYTNQTGFVGVEKFGEQSGGFQEDYANTFALFEDDSSILKLDVGVIVKVTHENDVITKFIGATDLENHEYFEGRGVVVANLTALFEKDGDLKNLYGDLSIEFLRVKLQNLSKFVVSEWTEAVELTRLKGVEKIVLSAGTVSWKSKDAYNGNYYVYLIKEDSLDLETGEVHGDYSVFRTTNTYFILSDKISELDEFYIAIQAVDTPNNILPSEKSFVMENDKIKLIGKNKITNKLSLSNGTMSFDWQNSDFVAFLNTVDLNDAVNGADELFKNTFDGPFTFTVSEIVSNKYVLRLRFTNTETNQIQTFDVDAREFLTNSFMSETVSGKDYTYEELILRLAAASGTSAQKDTINNFVKYLKDAKGVANSKNLFDDYFEALQAGNYNLEYCLVGRNYSISSNWVSFENTEGENSIYVTKQPNIRVVKETPDENDKSKNYYKVFIKMVEIHYFDNGVDTTKLADHYIWKVYKKTEGGETAFVFDINASGNGYAVTLEGVEGITARAVRCDSDGNTEAAEKNYLMFYLNLDENSILAKYGDEFDKTNYKFQTYAVGNDLSISSKTEVYEITFLGFDTGFSVIDGVFNWTTQMNRNTTVFYKKDSNLGEVKVVLDGSGSSITYQLKDEGLYNYIKFISIGEIAGNKIYVDSEIYLFKNVYKLAKPILQNVKGNIAINDSANRSWILGENESISGCYSTTELFNYKIYNNVSTETSYITLVDHDKAANLYLYETGTTNTANTSPEYDYKKTEENSAVQTFYVSSAGSTSQFVFEKDSEQGVVNAYCKTEKDGQEGVDRNASVAIASEVEKINAKMMNPISKVSIEDGILSWDKVEKSVLSYGNDETMNLTLQSGFVTVYKVTIKQYNEIGGEAANSESDNIFYRYTAEEKFDFAWIKENSSQENQEGLREEEKGYLHPEYEYIEVTVQALAMVVSQSIPEGTEEYTIVKLVDGRYGYKLATYSEVYKEDEQSAGIKFYVLMGHGATLNKITHTSHIDDESLEVVDGSIYWKYTLNGTLSSFEDYDLFADYKFTVYDKDMNSLISEDENGKPTDMEVVGKSESVTYDDDNNPVYKTTFRVKFDIADGLLASGANILNVYVNKRNDTKSIKSYGRSIVVNKMDVVDESYCNISEVSYTNADGSEIDESVVLEKLDISSYFQKYANATVTIKKYVTESYDGNTQDEDEGFNLSASNSVIYILNDSKLLGHTVIIDEQQVALSESNTIVIMDNGSFVLVINATSIDGEGVNKKNYIYSDTYDKIILNRISWLDEDVINWDINSQEFVWSYHGNFALQSDVDAVKVTENNGVFTESGDAQTTLGVGTLYKFIKHLDSENSIIQVEDEYYKIARENAIGPTFIVTINYTYFGKNNEEYEKTSVYYVNEYETKHDGNDNIYQEYKIQPTIIGQIPSISIRIKLGPTNIESQKNEDNSGHTFNLFSYGQGIETSPYEISTKSELENLQYRLSKSASLVEYDDIQTFFFKLTNDIDLGEFAGIKFDEFAGVFDGNNHTITYKSTAPATLDSQIRITNRGNSEHVYEQGIALFKKLTNTAVVKNLNLNVSFGEYSTTTNTILAGLTITNNGKLNNVNLTGFNTEFTGFRSSPTIGICYAGLVGANTGVDAEINACNNRATIEISTIDFESVTPDDEGYVDQYVRFAGIAGVNQATITGCSNGILNDTKISFTGKGNLCDIEIAGIALFSGTNAKIVDCVNNAAYEINLTNIIQPWNVDAAGIVIKNNGTITGNTNACYTDLTNANITVNQGEIFVA